MIGLEFLYRLMGVLVAGVALVNLRDRTNPRRWRNTAFWGLYAVTFLAAVVPLLRLARRTIGLPAATAVAVAGAGSAAPARQ